MKDSLRAVWRWVRWPLMVLGFLYAFLVGFRTFILFEEDKTAEAVAQIHAQKITLADVMGDTMIKTGVDKATYDATVAGIDSNNNGIRDDVEIAIWKKYPNSAKIRAAELQYAMTEQMYLTRVSNEETWRAVSEESDRAYRCIFQIFRHNITVAEIQETLLHSREVEGWVFNTQLRQNQKNRAYDFTTGYGTLEQESCDIDLNTLPN